MNHKQYLKEFAKGPCSPVMLIPGLLATKLMVKLNCEILMKYNNETFKKCGWNSCSKGFWEVKLIQFWKSVPKKEYIIWIPSFIGPMNVLSLSKSSQDCYVAMIHNIYDLSKQVDDPDFIRSKPGITVMIYGQTKNTRVI